MSKNWEHAAGILWSLLVQAAKDEKTLTYSELAPLIDTNPLSVGKGLGPILYYCLDNRLPPLTVLVIGKTSGVPGTGFIAWDIDDLPEAYKQVYTFNWDAVQNPFVGFGPSDTSASFAEKIIEDPDQAGDIYSRVKVRGTSQKIFRLALLEAYEYQCAMCQMSFEEVLEAAHIIPWSKCDKGQRISPKNGILLCSNHHKLFDSGDLSVTPEYTIEYKDDDFSEEEYSESDIKASVSLIGRKILLPENSDLWPSPELLKLRASG